MGKFRITGPDGKAYNVTGDNAQGALNALKKHLGSAQQQPVQEQGYQSPEYSVGGFLRNAGSDAYDSVAGAVNAIRHPVDTLRNVGTVTNGVLNKILPQALVDMHQARFGADEVAKENAVRGALADGISNAVQHPIDTAYNKPVSTAMALSTLLSGGATAAGKVPALANTAKVMDKAAELTNPVNAIAKPIAAVKAYQGPQKFIPKSSSDLYDAATKSYKAAENSGLTFTPDAFSKMVQGLDLKAAEAGIGGPLAKVTDKIYPKATSMRDSMVELSGQSPSLMDVVAAKRVAAAGGKGVDADASLMRQFGGSLNSATKNADPTDFIQSENMQTGLDALKSADTTWGRASKTSRIEDVISRAKDAQGANYTQAGELTSIRQQLRAEKKSKDFTRNWTPEEQKIITKIVRGGTVENLAKGVGKLAVRGPVSGATSILGGNAIGGPVGAAAMAGLGEIGKALATRLGKKNVNNLLEHVQTGTVAKSKPNAQAIINAFVNSKVQNADKIAGAGLAGSANQGVSDLVAQTGMNSGQLLKALLNNRDAAKSSGEKKAIDNILKALLRRPSGGQQPGTPALQ